MAEKVWTDDMGEISGFGGGYEATCRAMVLAAGIKWIDEHPDTDPQFRGYKNIYGVINEENEDAKALTAAVVAPTSKDYTGAMHQASIEHVLAYKRLGWEEYCRQLRERPPETT